MRRKPTGFFDASHGLANRGFAEPFAPSPGFAVAPSGIAVTRDATSNIYTPISSAEWATFRSAFSLTAPAPDSLWLLQESSGNAADSIGAFTLTATGTVTYQQSATGWTRKGVGTTDNVASHFTTTSGSLPLGGAASQTTLLIAIVPSAPAANRSLYNGQTGTTIRINSTPRAVCISGANTSTGTVSPVGAVRPYVYRENFTAASSTLMTDQEKLVPTHGTISGRNLSLGSSSAAAAAVIVYACAWYSAAAEIADADVRSLLQAMGFTVSW